MEELAKQLKEKALWVRQETLKIHKVAQETRVASSMSIVEVFVSLYYGGLLNFDATNPDFEGRDRLIISKGHGSISLYPILADVGYFDKAELKRISKAGSFIGSIPDPIIPGYETVNGSLGHGLGIACGMAKALKLKGRSEKVFAILGDGELYEGSVWEAVMLAGHHRLDNLIVIIDNNKISMLDFCKNIIDLDPLSDKFKAFKWKVAQVDGHDVAATHSAIKALKDDQGEMPKVLIADTVKAKGIPALEQDPLCHIKNVRPDDIDSVIKDLE